MTFEPSRINVSADTRTDALAKAHTERMEYSTMVEHPAVHLAGLSKVFRGGVTAVDGLSFTVERGQVFGLLGPNGSGKTTTLRMLVGLIHPTAGSAHLFGERVVPGHPVLRRVGALIEGPAFVPHLTGTRNLEFYWRAGGQDLGQANLQTALEVAELGSAIDRKVGTYSKGMQQRLALAQAMLNDPGLLILDEPTAGLDPQEMREIRQLIRNRAECGSTVILSSHILAEVEQVCSHAAVIDNGRLVASGTVEELTAATSSIYIEVDDVDKAMAVLTGLEGVVQVAHEAPGLALQLDGLKREAVVSALVRAGIGVETVTGRHTLEDAFLHLLEEELR